MEIDKVSMREVTVSLPLQFIRLVIRQQELVDGHTFFSTLRVKGCQNSVAPVIRVLALFPFHESLIG